MLNSSSPSVFERPFPQVEMPFAYRKPIAKPDPLSDLERRELERIVFQLLADEYVVYAATRDYHWIVAGPVFHHLIVPSEKHYRQAHTRLERVASRARALGLWSNGDWRELTRVARLRSETSSTHSTAGIIAQLISLHDSMIALLQRDIDTSAARAGDADPMGLLTRLFTDHEKSVWNLRALLLEVGEHPAQGVMPVRAAG